MSSSTSTLGQPVTIRDIRVLTVAEYHGLHPVRVPVVQVTRVTHTGDGGS